MFYDPRQHNGFYPINKGKNWRDEPVYTMPPARRQTAIGFLISLAPLVVTLVALAVMSIWKIH
jgi:hypothetical protein